MSTKDKLFLENELVGNVFILCKPFFFKPTWPAMAQAVSCWLLTVGIHIIPCGICGGQSGTGTKDRHA
jgi:hypothetical protein